MAEITVLPSTIEDIEAYSGSLPFVRARAMTARIDGEIVGLGGIAALPNGAAIAFLDLRAAMRSHAKFTLMRACRTGLRDAVARGITTISANASPDVKDARAFLERLGFRCTDPDAGVYIYEA